MEEELGHLIVFKEHLGKSDTIANGVVWRLSNEEWMISWIDFKLLKDVLEDGIHVIPVLHYSSLNWVTQLQ